MREKFSRRGGFKGRGSGKSFDERYTKVGAVWVNPKDRDSKADRKAVQEALDILEEVGASLSLKFDESDAGYLLLVNKFREKPTDPGFRAFEENEDSKEERSSFYKKKKARKDDRHTAGSSRRRSREEDEDDEEEESEEEEEEEDEEEDDDDEEEEEPEPRKKKAVKAPPVKRPAREPGDETEHDNDEAPF